MSQFSFPWAGVAPGSGADAGRYTALQWWGIWASLARSAGLITDSTTTLLRTLAALTNLGVFYSVGNQLEVTNPGGAANEIQINTGAAIVEGGFYYNNVAVTFNVPDNRTNDLIVVRKNYSGSTYTPPANTDPDELVPPYTTRVTRVTPAGFEQDTSRAAYWDVPLADFTTDGAGVVTLNSDDREYVDAETKQLWIPAQGGWNTTDGTEIKISSNPVGFPAQVISVRLPNLKLSLGYGQGTYPLDYITDGQLTAVFLSGIGGGSAYLDARIDQGACGSVVSGFGGTVAWALYAVTASRILCAPVITSLLATLTPGAYFRCSARRDATVGTGIDTAAGDVDLQGFYLNYLGWR